VEDSDLNQLQKPKSSHTLKVNYKSFLFKLAWTQTNCDAEPQREAIEEEVEEEEEEFPKKKIGTKKLAKLQMKEQMRKNREAEEEMRERKRKQEEKEREELKKKQEEREAEERRIVRSFHFWQTKALDML
jgi:hypothetical protein